MTIELSEYSPEWKRIFEEEKEKISKDFPLNPFAVEHIGSTSVPNLKAKPVIDILVGVKTLPLDISTITNHMQILGYQYIEQYNESIPERRFFQKEMNGIRTHHIHLVEIHSAFWERHIFFRNQLRDNPIIRQQYEDLKILLAEKHWDDINDYASAKTDFIGKIEKQLAN